MADGTPGDAGAMSSRAAGVWGGFPVERMGRGGRVGLLGRLLADPYGPFALLRWAAPVARIPRKGWYLVTRSDHVREVLAADRAFRVPWRDKMAALADDDPAGTPADDEGTFVLGLDDRAAHRRALEQLTPALRREDVPWFGAEAERLSRAILDEHREAARRPGGPAHFDAVQDLVTLVPTRLCRRYFGVAIPEDREKERAFAHWSFAISVHLFGDPGDDPAARDLAADAAARMRRVLRASVAAARGAAPAGPDTVVRRLVAAGLSDRAILVHLMGLITGFVPTNTVAAGHILDVLLGGGRFLGRPRRDVLAPTLQALHEGDRERFTRCLFEASRFKPINPGPFRVVAPGEGYVLEGAGPFGRGPKRLPAGATVWASTQSAMFDGRRVREPRRFDPDRAPSEYLLFGSGLHACLGLFLARAQIGAMLGVLLGQPGLRRAGPMTRLGPFPEHLPVTFAPHAHPEAAPCIRS